MIEYAHGNLLDAGTEALVCPVNCVGVMGKGVALHLADAFPAILRPYQLACRNGILRPGVLMTLSTGVNTPRYVVMLPTKRHWRDLSSLDDVSASINALPAEITRLGIASMAIPAVGCGNGGLSWETVRPLVEAACAHIPHVRALIYGPYAIRTSR